MEEYKDIKDTKDIKDIKEITDTTDITDITDISTEHCMVCGSSLEYLEKGRELDCSYCGRVDQGYIACPQGHYVCNTCHNRDALGAIEEVALTTTLKDPVEIAEL